MISPYIYIYISIFSFNHIYPFYAWYGIGIQFRWWVFQFKLKPCGWRDHHSGREPFIFLSVNWHTLLSSTVTTKKDTTVFIDGPDDESGHKYCIFFKRVLKIAIIIVAGRSLVIACYKESEYYLYQWVSFSKRGPQIFRSPTKTIQNPGTDIRPTLNNSTGSLLYPKSWHKFSLRLGNLLEHYL